MIASHVVAVRTRIAAACGRGGRPPESVRLIGVAKGRAPAQIAQLLSAGVDDIGENYVQEAQARRAALGADAAGRARWHLIGHLQRNKARPAAGLFQVIQSVDSEPLAVALDRHAAEAGAFLDALIEVNVAGEASKSGAEPRAAGALANALRRLPHLRLRGLMTMAPLGSGGEAARPYFQRLRALRDAIDPSLPELSMGMSDDFEVAIEEGATMVRIGRALFGETGT